MLELRSAMAFNGYSSTYFLLIETVFTRRLRIKRSQQRRFEILHRYGLESQCLAILLSLHERHFD